MEIDKHSTGSDVDPLFCPASHTHPFPILPYQLYTIHTHPSSLSFTHIPNRPFIHSCFTRPYHSQTSLPCCAIHTCTYTPALPWPTNYIPVLPWHSYKSPSFPVLPYPTSCTPYTQNCSAIYIYTPCLIWPCHSHTPMPYSLLPCPTLPAVG